MHTRSDAPEVRDDAARRSQTLIGLVNLLVVYGVWSSTYLAIRLAVREGSGFPPFFMGGTRLLVASLLLAIWLRLRGVSMAVSRRDLAVMAVAGLLLWVGGNGMVNWAEQHAGAGYSALVIGSTPIWACLMEAVLDRKRPAHMLLFSLLVGFLGLAVLTYPSLRSGNRAELLSTLALLLAPLGWGGGSVYLSRKATSLAPTVASTYQQFFGGIGFLAAAVLIGEPVPTPSATAYLAWSYLIVFGSLFAYTSYLITLRLLPISVVMTYAYVNPLIAVLLGWLVLHEQLSWWTAAGTVLILLGVAGVFHARYGRRNGSRTAPATAGSTVRH